MAKKTTKEQPKPFKSLSPLQTSGQETIQDMSLIEAPYLEYLVTKSGYLVAALKTSGINIQLFSDDEQKDIFDDYGAFLISNFVSIDSGSMQTIDMTVPVDFKNYNLGWRKRYLDAKDKQDEMMARIRASYLVHYEDIDSRQEMNTKEHLIVIREKIEEDNFEALELSAKILDERCLSIITTLREQFEEYDLNVMKVDANEYKEILNRYTNFNNR